MKPGMPQGAGPLLAQAGQRLGEALAAPAGSASPKPATTLGQRMNEERRRLGFTQQGAATRADVTREQWGRYERGASPNVRTLQRIAEHGFDVTYIITGTRKGAAL